MPAYKGSKRAARCEIATTFDRRRYEEASKAVDARVTNMWATENQELTHIMALELSMENFGVKEHILEAIEEGSKSANSNVQEKFFRLFLKEADTWEQGGGKADIYSWQFLRAGKQMERCFERKDCKEVSQFVRQITHIAQQLAVDSFKLFNLEDKFDRKIKCYNGFINLGTFNDPGMDEHLDNELTADGKEQEFFTIMIPIYCVDGYGQFCLRETLGSRFETPLTYDLSCAYALNNRVAHYVRASKCRKVRGQKGYRMVAVFHFQMTKKKAPTASHAVPTTLSQEVVLVPLEKEEVKCKGKTSAKSRTPETREMGVNGKPAKTLVTSGSSSRTALTQIPAKVPLPEPEVVWVQDDEEEEEEEVQDDIIMIFDDDDDDDSRPGGWPRDELREDLMEETHDEPRDAEPMEVQVPQDEDVVNSSSQSSSHGSRATRSHRRESFGSVSACGGSFVAYKKAEPNPSSFLRELPKPGMRRTRSSKRTSQSPQDEEKQAKKPAVKVPKPSLLAPSASPAAAAAPSSIMGTASRGPKVVKSASRAPLVKKLPTRAVAKKPIVVTVPTQTQSPKVVSSRWTIEEDALLKHLVKKHGKPQRWSDFENAFLLKGFRFRGTGAISHRWSRLMKK